MTGKYRTYGKQAYNEVALFLVGTVITSYLHFVGVRQYGKICHMITLACCVGGIGARYSAAFGGPLSSSLTRDVWKFKLKIRFFDNQSNIQSISQSVNQSVCLSVCLSVSQSINQLINEIFPGRNIAERLKRGRDESQICTCDWMASWGTKRAGTPFYFLTSPAIFCGPKVHTPATHSYFLHIYSLIWIYTQLVKKYPYEKKAGLTNPSFDVQATHSCSNVIRLDWKRTKKTYWVLKS